MHRRTLHSFPTRRSSDLNEELTVSKIEFLVPLIHYLLEDKSYRTPELLSKIDEMLTFSINQGDTAKSERAQYNEMGLDRKSTRLNSSHVAISYAVFCLTR